MLTEKQIIENKKLINKQISVYSRKLKTLSKRGKAYKHTELLIIKLRSELKAMSMILKDSKFNYNGLKYEKSTLSIAERITMIKPLVRAVLKSDFPSRDDDNLLCIRVWELQGSKPNMKLSSFQKKLVLGKFAMGDSITRERRRLQAKYPSLRGNEYEARHQAEVKFKNQYRLDLD